MPPSMPAYSRTVLPQFTLLARIFTHWTLSGLASTLSTETQDPPPVDVKV